MQYPLEIELVGAQLAIAPGFADITVGEKNYNLAHLAPLYVVLDGAGKNNNDIRVRVSFKSHCFSVSCPAGTAHHFLDESGRGRTVCDVRYEKSFELPIFCRSMIENNHITWISHDNKSNSNLAIADGTITDSEHYAVYYYLYPSKAPNTEVELVVKSAYMQFIKFSAIRRRFRVVQKIKECHYNGVTIPK